MATNIDAAFNRVYAAKTAQSVWNDLTELKLKRTVRHTRWIWELLQNAHDASTPADNNLIAEIKYRQGKLAFSHNGRSFKADEVAHLICSGTTKGDEEDKETLGQYGTGFLTTHLLSLKIDVSGQLDDARWFDFTLARDMGSRNALYESMEQAREDFNNSLSDQKPSIPVPFTTQFIYPIEEDAADAVDAGIEMLKQCAPYVIVFNQKFCRIEIDIDIKEHREKLCFEALERRPLDEDQIQQITVAEGNSRERTYLLARGEKASVTIQLESNNDAPECLPIGETPRIFLGFPLIGTESFSFPAVINSFEFSTIPDRDGVPLGRSKDEEDLKNQTIIEEAYALLVHMLRYAASSGWHHAHLLAQIPSIPLEKDWLDPDWLRGCIKEKLIDEIRQTPTIITEAGEVTAPKDAALVLAKTDTGVKALWDLLNGWQENSEMLPRQDEAVGWYNAVESWANISDRQATSFDEVVNGEKLASRVQKSQHVSRLALKDGICKINWLDQLIGFLRDNGLSEVIHKYSVVPSQEGSLHTPLDLNRDKGIAEELKDIAELLGWPVRNQLCDTGISSLDDQTGMGDCSSENIVGTLVKLLQKRAEQSPDHNFEKASVRLFAWIVGQNNWNLLSGFPVFAKESDSDSLLVLYLPRPTSDDKPPLAPIGAWPKGLEIFSDLFPPRRIIAAVFFKVVPDLDAWRMLSKRGFIRVDMITAKKEYVSEFRDETLTADDHETVDLVEVTDIVDREEIMRRVRDSRPRARLFWRFLTEWLIKKDVQGLQIEEATCKCDDIHQYYQAVWLESVRKDRWIRLAGKGDRRDHAKADSLAKLLQGSGWALSSLNKNPSTVKLLEAINVNPSDLRLEFITENDEERNELVNSMTELHHVTQGNLNQIHALVQYLQDDEELIPHLAERQKRRELVFENQDLGRWVESIVKESLEGVGFKVNRKPIGSDFEIEHDLVEDNEEIGIELVQGHKSWLIEVKATRGKQVRMTSTQAKTAVKKKDNFLLCVVPLDFGDTEAELDTVRTKMRFVTDIGSQIDQLCKNLNAFEQLRDDITAGDDSGIRLEVILGTAGIRVAHTVWENAGLPLETLGDHFM